MTVIIIMKERDRQTDRQTDRARESQTDRLGNRTKYNYSYSVNLYNPERLTCDRLCLGFFIRNEAGSIPFCLVNIYGA